MIIICEEIRRRFTLRNARLLSHSLSLGSGDDLRMIKFARARSLKRNNGSLFSRLSPAEKYLTVRISRRRRYYFSHVEVLSCCDSARKIKATRSVYGPACLGTRMNVRVKEGKKRQNEIYIRHGYVRADAGK